MGPLMARALTWPLTPFCAVSPSGNHVAVVVSQRAMRLTVVPFCVLLLTEVKPPPT